MVTAENVAVVDPLAVAGETVAEAWPSTFSVTAPLGGTVPAGGEPTTYDVVGTASLIEEGDNSDDN